MGRGKDAFIARTSGYRVGESRDEFAARTAEIEKIEADIREHRVSLFDLEKACRRLCELKGQDYEGYDPEDD